MRGRRIQAIAEVACRAKPSNWPTSFCDPYTSLQNGAVENSNERLERDLPRKINIDELSDQQLQDNLLMHNLTPRKWIGFKTQPAISATYSITGGGTLRLERSFNIPSALEQAR